MLNLSWANNESKNTQIPKETRNPNNQVIPFRFFRFFRGLK